MRRVAALAAVLLLLLAGAALALDHPRDDRRLPSETAKRTIAVYVVHDAFHSDIALSADVLALGDPGSPSGLGAATLAPAPYVAFGWGDAKFYMHRGSGPARWLDLLRAGFAPGNAATVHVERIDDPSRLPPPWRALRLQVTPQGLAALRARLDASFAPAADGRRPVLLAPSTGDDAFFAGRGHPSLVAECNQWVGEVLGAAGGPHNRLLDATSAGLALDLRRRAGATPVPPATGAPP